MLDRGAFLTHLWGSVKRWKKKYLWMLPLFQIVLYQLEKKLYQLKWRLVFLCRELQEAEFERPTLQAHWGFGNLKVLWTQKSYLCFYSSGEGSFEKSASTSFFLLVHSLNEFRNLCFIMLSYSSLTNTTSTWPWIIRWLWRCYVTSWLTSAVDGEWPEGPL